MEREVMLTGIGGQGVQLAAQVLARAAGHDGRQAMLFGVYGGMMRGGNSDSTVVVADDEVTAPPLLSRCWSVIALHHRYWPPLAGKLDPGGLLVINPPVFDAEVEVQYGAVIEVRASEIAADMDFPMGASMVMTGAYAAITGLVSLDACIAAVEESLPPYRRQHLPRNVEALQAGFDNTPRLTAPAWDVPVPA